MLLVFSLVLFTFHYIHVLMLLCSLSVLFWSQIFTVIPLVIFSLNLSFIIFTEETFLSSLMCLSGTCCSILLLSLTKCWVTMDNETITCGRNDVIFFLHGVCFVDYFSFQYAAHICFAFLLSLTTMPQLFLEVEP